MVLVFESLWNRARPGADATGLAIRTRQWTAIHLSARQQASGIIPLNHIARPLTFDRPIGPTKVHTHGQTLSAERLAHCVVVPPGVLTSPIVHIRHTANGFLLNHEAPNLSATFHLVEALRRVGWVPETDPFDDEGAHILPALVRATVMYPTLRARPTLPLSLVHSLMFGQTDDLRSDPRNDLTTIQLNGQASSHA